MSRSIVFSTLGLAAAAAACVAARAVPASRAPVNTTAGIYSGSQAEEGAQLYAKSCAMCHGRMLEGTNETPALTGKFMASWGNRPLGDLYDYVGRAMPQYAPGSLTPEDDARLVAFLLKANGMPEGHAPLPADGAKLHAIMLAPAIPIK